RPAGAQGTRKDGFGWRSASSGAIEPPLSSRALAPDDTPPVLLWPDTFYDFGMLARAKGLLLQILDELAPEIEAGIPIVGLDPSCVAVFRDELLNLLPHDERAQALSRQT